MLKMSTCKFIEVRGENINSLVPQDPPTLSIFSLVVELQTNWKKTFLTREEIRAKEEKLLWANAKSYLNEVTNSLSEDDYEGDVLSSVANLCIVLSGFGELDSRIVMRETQTVLLSVMKLHDVRKYFHMTPEGRKDHVLEVSQIVMGIRIFNKDCRKGGAGIDDLPKILTRASKATSYRLIEEAAAATSRCNFLTTYLVKLYGLRTRDSTLDLKPYLPARFKEEDAEEIKACLCFARLHQSCLRLLSAEVKSSEIHIKNCVELLRTSLIQVHETVKYKVAIPTIEVYPKFVQLSMIWRDLQYETATLSHINHLIDALNFLTADMEEPELLNFLKVNKCVKVSEGDIPPLHDPCTCLKLKGYCPWTLIQTGGVVIPGSFVFQDYAFRSPSAAEHWFKNLDLSLSKLQTVLTSRPHLLAFFDLTWANVIEDEVPSSPETSSLSKDVCENGTQTCTHPIPSYIDKEYFWSEWEMKRRAMQLTRLLNCKTRSQQTEDSKFRSSIHVQTITIADKACGKTSRR